MIDESGVSIRMSDGVDVSVRIYRPDGEGPFPTLFAASPYRYDNDDMPQTMIFFWHEVGPIHWYVARGYAYVHLDVRGSGRSGGEYGFFDSRERRDLYEVIEWIAQQPWSNGKVGGIGQSYYAAAQWCMAVEHPPHLTCIAPYDGGVDFYRGWYYKGGLVSNFSSTWWNGSVRMANKSPRAGEPRIVTYDLVNDFLQHELIDEFWDERAIDAKLSEVDIPVHSVGVWVKRDIHLNGNIRGFHRVKGPKKLSLSGAPTLPQALGEFASPEFHEKVLAPFYDYYLKGEDNGYDKRPTVDYTIGGTDTVAYSETWPPAEVVWTDLYLKAQGDGSVTSLNDGGLAPEISDGASSTSYSYPDAQWAVGPVALTPHGLDPVRRVLTFTSDKLDADLVVTGAPTLDLYLSSSRDDATVIAKLSIQHERSEADRAAGRQPRSEILSKGWLRASHRALDPSGSLAGEPYHPHRVREPIEPGQVYRLQIEMTHIAHLFPAGSRIRLELACADSTVTDAQFTHAFTPDMVGSDTYHHDRVYPSRIALPVFQKPNV